MKKKSFIMALALVLVFAVAVGGVVAWLTDKTAEVKNTFTVGDINITLTETDTDAKGEKNYDIVPGDKESKDPIVTVMGGSEDCYLFVKFDVAKNTVGDKTIVKYEMVDGWQLVDGETNVYYKVVTSSTADQKFNILKDFAGVDTNGSVLINPELTKTDIAAIKEAGAPTLTFTAYAVQKDNIDNVADAWAQVKNA